MLIADAKAICLGSYCFVWGQKQEKTSTWYGMFLPTGEKLPQVDAISRAWTGQWPSNRCPRVDPIQCEFVNATIAPGVLVKAKLPAIDPNKDSMTWQWIVQAESTTASVGGDREPIPPVFEECIVGQDGDEVILRTPVIPSNYRFFAIVRDGRGGAAAENICFQVKVPVQ